MWLASVNHSCFTGFPKSGQQGGETLPRVTFRQQALGGAHETCPAIASLPNSPKRMIAPPCRNSPGARRYPNRPSANMSNIVAEKHAGRRRYSPPVRLPGSCDERGRSEESARANAGAAYRDRIDSGNPTGSGVTGGRIPCEGLPDQSRPDDAQHYCVTKTGPASPEAPNTAEFVRTHRQIRARRRILVDRKDAQKSAKTQKRPRRTSLAGVLIFGCGDRI